MRRGVLVVSSCAVAVVLVAVACNGDEPLPPSPTLVINTTATPLPTATPRNPEVRTGIPEIDALIDALLVEPARARREAIRPLLGFTPAPCSLSPSEIGPRPICRLGEAEGQPVDAFTFDTCGVQALRPDEVDQVVILLANATMYAAYRAPETFGETADYVVIVYHVVGNEQQATELNVKGEKVVAYLYSCTTTAADLAETLGLTDVVYEAGGG